MDQRQKITNTYSIIARDPQTGDLGIGVQTHQIGVGWMVPWLLPGFGAVATQSLVNLSFGPMGLAMLKEGVSAPKIVEGLIASDTRPDVRQVAVIDSNGRVGAWTGSGCIQAASHHIGDGYAVLANMMEKESVIPAMRDAFESTPGRFAERLLSALEAAETEGGDIRGQQSAAIKIVVGDPVKGREQKAWETVYDLRVDEHPNPVTELKRLVRLRTSQLISEEGDRKIESGLMLEGLELWKDARQMAPELEEIGFWQAMVLADNEGDIKGAAEILYEVFHENDRRELWLDLVDRIQTCGIIERKGVALELRMALEELDFG